MSKMRTVPLSYKLHANSNLTMYYNGIFSHYKFMSEIKK